MRMKHTLHQKRLVKDSRADPLLLGLFLIGEALVRRLDKHIRRPAPGRLAVQRIPIRGGLGRLDLLERHPVLDHVLNSVANDRDHLLVYDDVRLVAEPPVPRDDHRSAFRVRAHGGQVDQPVQTFDDRLNAAAGFQVNERITGEVEQIARAHYVGLAEQDDTVPVRIRRLMHDLNRLAVEVELLLRRRVGIVWPGVFRSGRHLAGGRAHPLECVLRRDDKGAFGAASAGARQIVERNRLTGGGDL